MSRIAEPRAFFAVMPGAAWARGIGTRLMEAGLDKRLGDALVPLENLHQSLSASIRSPSEMVRSALLGVGEAICARSFTMYFNRIEGRAIEPGNIQCTMRARGVPKAFTALLKEVQACLVQAGFGHIATGVTPHMTLSYRAPEPLDKIVLDPLIAWTIDELCLVVGGGHPYRYDIIGRWPLLPEIDPPATQPGLF
jgi:2'-5' RNA ligase